MVNEIILYYDARSKKHQINCNDIIRFIVKVMFEIFDNISKRKSERR